MNDRQIIQELMRQVSELKEQYERTKVTEMGAGGGGGAPANAEYVVLALDASLTQERVLTAGSGISIVDAGANSTVTVSVDGTVVRTTRNINTTLPLTGGGPLSSDLTLAINVFHASGPAHAIGAVPDPGAVVGTTKFLREDATWAVPSGSGGSSDPFPPVLFLMGA